MRKTNCAGQGCPERDGCLRYEERIPHHFETKAGREFPVYEWASFDLERQKLGGLCPSRIQMMRRKAA